MGGTIWVDSDEGKGSTFSFTINAKKAQSKGTSKSSDISINSNMAAEHPLRILMAEDNRINQLVAKKTLERKLGYTIDIAANGSEALQMLRSKKYDIILMDCLMPEMDGFEATKKIKENPSEYNNPTVVALTASALKEDRDKCFEAGMDDFLSKPLNIKEIIRVLKNCKQNG
jgi:CheY-like chemotaxis protein